MRSRPRVELAIPEVPSEVTRRFRLALEAPGCPCEGGVSPGWITLRVGPEQRRPWSPWLQLQVGGTDDRTVLRGVMGPQPEIWTAFVFVYAAMLCAVVAGGVYGGVQVSLGQPATGGLVGAAGLVGLGCACGCDLLGRRLGEGQMGLLRGFVERVGGVDARDV